MRAPSCDMPDCGKRVMFTWFGQLLCERHAWIEHERGDFKECPWHGRWCPCRKTVPRTSDYVRRKAKAAVIAAKERR